MARGAIGDICGLDPQMSPMMTAEDADDVAGANALCVIRSWLRYLRASSPHAVPGSDRSQCPESFN